MNGQFPPKPAPLMPKGTTNCHYCGRITQYIGSRCCDDCWEVSKRVSRIDPEVLTKILKDQGFTVQPSFNLTRS